MGFPVPPPSADERIVWPGPFGTRFTIFCDVEEEFDWRGPFRRDAWSTRAMAAFPAAHQRFVAAGCGLACMVDHPIATDPAAVAALACAAEGGRSTIGAQLHPWVTPPFDEPLGPVNSYAGNLPPALEAAKIDRLTAAIAAAFGRAPIAFRAGRYGIGPATLPLLAARGYRLDSSVRARYDYRGDGGPDFRRVGNAAFRRNGMVELPFTTVHAGLLRGAGQRLYRAAARLPRGAGLLARARLVSRVSLTPEDMPLADALAAIEVAVGEGERLLAFSFHSPSLAPGHTPYVRDAADLLAFWRWWDAVLGPLARLGVAHASLAEILAAADHSPGR